MHYSAGLFAINGFVVALVLIKLHFIFLNLISVSTSLPSRIPIRS